MARDFSGTSQYITSPAPAITGDVSLACWVNLDTWAYPSNVVDLAGIFGKMAWGADANGDCRLDLIGPTTVAEEVLRFVAWTSTGEKIAAFDVDPAPAAGWHHICGVHDETGDQVRLYLDGAQVATGTATGTLSNNAHGIAIGAYAGNETNTELNGRVAECSIWNRLLSAAEIAFLAKSFSPRLPYLRPRLSYHMRLDGRHNTELDIVGGRRGAVVGATIADHPRIISPFEVPRRRLSPSIGAVTYVFAAMDDERELNPAHWDGTVTCFLEIHGKTSNAAQPFNARLYNITTAAAVAGSEVTIASTSNIRGRSGAFSLPAGTNIYRVQYGGVAGFTYTPDPDSHAVLIVDVS